MLCALSVMAAVGPTAFAADVNQSITTNIMRIPGPTLDL